MDGTDDIQSLRELRESLPTTEDAIEMANKSALSEAGWKVSLFLAGCLVSFLVFWFGAGGGIVTNQGAILEQLKSTQSTQLAQQSEIQSLTDAVNNVREATSVLEQRVSDDEERRH